MKAVHSRAVFVSGVMGLVAAGFGPGIASAVMVDFTIGGTVSVNGYDPTPGGTGGTVANVYDASIVHGFEHIWQYVGGTPAGLTSPFGFPTPTPGGNANIGYYSFQTFPVSITLHIDTDKAPVASNVSSYTGLTYASSASSAALAGNAVWMTADVTLNGVIRTYQGNYNSSFSLTDYNAYHPSGTQSQFSFTLTELSTPTANPSQYDLSGIGVSISLSNDILNGGLLADQDFSVTPGNGVYVSFNLYESDSATSRTWLVQDYGRLESPNVTHMSMSSAVPEPASLALTLIGSHLLLRRGRREC